MLDETKYPHFIPDKPQGEDVFEGKSQEHLANSICNYIRSIDILGQIERMELICLAS